MLTFVQIQSNTLFVYSNLHDMSANKDRISQISTESKILLLGVTLIDGAAFLRKSNTIPSTSGFEREQHPPSFAGARCVRTSTRTREPACEICFPPGYFENSMILRKERHTSALLVCEQIFQTMRGFSIQSE